MMLSDVCPSVTHIKPKSRTERPRKSKIGTEVAQVTRDSDTTFKIKRSKVKVTKPLRLVVLACQHGYTVMVTCPYAYMMYIMSPLAGLDRGISWRLPAYSLLLPHSNVWMSPPVQWNFLLFLQHCNTSSHTSMLIKKQPFYLSMNHAQ